MAYSFGTPVVSEVGTHRGRKHYLLTVTETGVTGNTDEWSMVLATYSLPRVGVVKAVEVTMTVGAGNATTVDPEAGMATGGTDVYSNGAAGAGPILLTPNGLIWPRSATLYGQSNANGTADTIVTKILIAEGSDE